MLTAQERQVEQLRCAWCHESLTRERECHLCGLQLHIDCAEEAQDCPTLGCPARVAQPALVGPEPQRLSPLATVLLLEFFGALMPIACCVLDQQVGVCRAVFGSSWLPFLWTFGAVQIVLLQIGLLRPEVCSSFLGGALLAGAAFATGIGLIILPESILGLLFVIGLLGFVPFVTAGVFFVVARRCLVAAERVKWLDVALGAVVVVILTWLAVQQGALDPLLPQWVLDRSDTW